MQAWVALGNSEVEVRDARAWLYRIVHNVAISQLRRPIHDSLDVEDGGQTGDAGDEVERRLEVRAALAGLASLPELQRRVMLSTALEGRSHDEVADALGLSHGAVRGLIYRARATLRAGGRGDHAVAVDPVGRAPGRRVRTLGRARRGARRWRIGRDRQSARQGRRGRGRGRRDRDRRRGCRKHWASAGPSRGRQRRAITRTGRRRCPCPKRGDDRCVGVDCHVRVKRCRLWWNSRGVAVRRFAFRSARAPGARAPVDPVDRWIGVASRPWAGRPGWAVHRRGFREFRRLWPFRRLWRRQRLGISAS